MFTRALNRYGETVSVWRKVPMTRDETGNTTYEWVEVGNEPVIIKVSSRREAYGLPGAFRDAEAVAYLKPSTIIKAGDRIYSTQGMFEVTALNELFIRGCTSHVKAKLRRVVD